MEDVYTVARDLLERCNQGGFLGTADKIRFLCDYVIESEVPSETPDPKPEKAGLSEDDKTFEEIFGVQDGDEEVEEKEDD